MVGRGPAARRVVFAGTPGFAVDSLEALVAAGIRPVAVYTQPDRPAGRGRKLQPSPVKQAALRHGIPVVQPTSLREPGAIAELAALEPDLIVVVAYGQILTQAVLDLPKYGCINVHASLLPRWRGAAPIHRALLAGDRETGVAIMRMEAGLDTGPVYLMRSTPIQDDDTAGSLHDRLAALGAEALMQVLDSLDTRTATPQAAEGVTWARKLDKDEAWLDWHASAVELGRQVRAFDPWPVAQARIGDEVLRIWKAAVIGDTHTAPPGTVLEAGAQGIAVATGDGALRLLEVQRAGGRRITAADFANQRSLKGQRFE